MTAIAFVVLTYGKNSDGPDDEDDGNENDGNSNLVITVMLSYAEMS